MRHNLTSLASLVKLGQYLPKIMPYLVRLVRKQIYAEYFDGPSGGPPESYKSYKSY